MPGQCPICRQPLPEAIDENELQARIEKLASPVLAVEKKKLTEEFETQLVPEGGEFDTLGVRFAYSREQVDQKLIRNDPRLDDHEAKADQLIDFVIAEVKSGNRNRLNSIWQPGNEDEKVNRIAYLLRWMGALGDEQRIAEVARRLQREHRAKEGVYLFRLVYFSKSHTQQAVPANVPQITFKEIAEFIIKLRAPCWKAYGFGVRSQHEQWDKLICDIWEVGNPDSDQSDAEKIKTILALLSE
jgi:hypothetical protein